MLQEIKTSSDAVADGVCWRVKTNT